MYALGNKTGEDDQNKFLLLLCSYVVLDCGTLTLTVFCLPKEYLLIQENPVRFACLLLLLPYVCLHYLFGHLSFLL